MIGGGQRFHCAIAAARGNKSGGGRSTIESEIQRTLRPMQRFVIVHEWRLHEDEHAQIDIVRTQECRGGSKLFEGHALVEARQNIRMNSFKSHGDFEPALQAIAESQAMISRRGRDGFRQ